jgi:hypothetical protein
MFHHGRPIFFVVNLAFSQAQQAKEAAEVGCGQWIWISMAATVYRGF